MNRVKLNIFCVYFSHQNQETAALSLRLKAAVSLKEKANNKNPPPAEKNEKITYFLNTN